MRTAVIFRQILQKFRLACKLKTTRRAITQGCGPSFLQEQNPRTCLIVGTCMECCGLSTPYLLEVLARVDLMKCTTVFGEPESKQIKLNTNMCEMIQITSRFV